MEQKKFEQLDSLRFFAILIVLLAHWGEKRFYILSHVFQGARGVNLFFVISGFLITLGLIRSKYNGCAIQTSLFKFYIRRSLRIFPIYYLTLLFLWLFDYSRIADSMAWNMFYASNFYNIKIHDWGNMGHLWSLAVEEQFYLVWPFIILINPKKILPYLIVGAILISEMAKLYWFARGEEYWWYEYVHPIGALDSLAIGGLLSYFYYFHQSRLKTALYNYYVITAVFVIAVIGQYLSSHYFFLTDRFFMSVFFAWLIGRSAFGFTGTAGYILNSKILRYIGKISYGIYLIAPLAPGLFTYMKYPIDPNLRFLIYIAAIIGIASISWYAFEKPILKLKEKFE